MLITVFLVAGTLVGLSCVRSEQKVESTITLADVVDFEGMHGWAFVHTAQQPYKTIQASVIQYTNTVDGKFLGTPLIAGAPYTGATRTTDSIKVIFQWQDGHVRGNLRYSEPRSGAGTQTMPELDSGRIWICDERGHPRMVDGEIVLMAEFATNPPPAWDKRYMKAYISVEVTEK